MKANRVLALATATVVLQGCSIFGGALAANCLESTEQPYQVEICDNRSETGWCTARHYETRTRTVCTSYE